MPKRATPEIEDLKQAVSDFREGKYDAALASFESAAKANRDLPPPKLMLARLLLAAGDAPRGRLLLEQVAIEKPDSPAIFLLFGDLALAEKRISDAALNFEKAVDCGTLTEREIAKLAAGRATVAEARGNWSAAAEVLDGQLGRNPDDAAIRLRLARSLVRQAKANEAYKLLQEGETDVAATGEGVLPPAILVGQFFTEAGQREEARQWLTQGLKEHPQNAAAYATVAVWHLEVGEPEPARNLIATAEKLSPNLVGLARLRGRAALQLQDTAVAEREFEALYRRSPSDAEAVDGLARALVAQQDDAKRRRAVELAEVNARQYPQNPQTLATLGHVYLAVGRLEDAERVLSAAVSGGRATSETAYDLARVLDARGRDEEARTLVQQALVAIGPFARREEAKEWLERLPAPTAETKSEQRQTKSPSP